MNTQELKEQLYKDKKKSLEIIKKLESNLKQIYNHIWTDNIRCEGG